MKNMHLAVILKANEYIPDSLSNIKVYKNKEM